MTPRLNRRLTLEAPTRTPDGAGGFTLAWEPLGTLWAAVAPGSLKLQDQPGAAEARQPLRVTVRGAPHGAPSRPVPGQRFREGSRLYAITAVTEADADARFLLCLAREEAAL